ncbi:hypothetical protein A6P39_004790 [Streptomyces sp. FXJ1.172]|uniref:hypothetical protein n=1 Tax=Streptomyces sp. FXJ1.172 TaxID=710705 RepID=UPI000AEDC6D4|nr:hypothetical protein [Streptomyces sp. FXJ1.172]WEO93393.1 hypothetical protein A6P39_004790 [Streptomyces sp. FXJ1.172]
MDAQLEAVRPAPGPAVRLLRRRPGARVGRRSLTYALCDRDLPPPRRVFVAHSAAPSGGREIRGRNTPPVPSPPSSTRF